MGLKMPEYPKKFSRQELYEKVWQTPMTQLAKQYGLSDVGLAKICKKYDIPRPPRGYWAKKSAGMIVEKQPLPKRKGNDDIVISSSHYSREGVEAGKSVQDYRPEMDIGQIVVPKRLTKPHPLIEKAIRILEVSRPNENGLLVSRRSNCLDVKVSSQILSRAMRIMDTLLKSLNALDFDVKIRNGDTIVAMDNIEIPFGIREELKTEQTLLDSDLDGSYSFHHSRYRTVKKPSGKLCLSVQDFYSDRPLRKNWRDTKKKRLEDQIDKVIVGFMKISAEKKERIRQREEQERQRQEMIKRRKEEELRREELRIQIEKEQARVSGLIENAENWHTSKLIRDFISAVEQMRLTGSCDYKPDCPWGEWIIWAKSQADRLDPLSPSPTSILDEDVGTDSDAVDPYRDKYWY